MAYVSLVSARPLTQRRARMDPPPRRRAALRAAVRALCLGLIQHASFIRYLMSREPRRKEKWGSDPRGTKWAKGPPPRPLPSSRTSPTPHHIVPTSPAVSWASRCARGWASRNCPCAAVNRRPIIVVSGLPAVVSRQSPRVTPWSRWAARGAFGGCPPPPPPPLCLGKRGDICTSTILALGAASSHVSTICGWGSLS